MEHCGWLNRFLDLLSAQIKPQFSALVCFTIYVAFVCIIVVWLLIEGSFHILLDKLGYFRDSTPSQSHGLVWKKHKTTEVSNTRTKWPKVTQKTYKMCWCVALSPNVPRFIYWFRWYIDCLRDYLITYIFSCNSLFSHLFFHSYILLLHLWE